MCNLVDGYIEANSFSYQFRYSISNTIAFNIPLRYPYNICISRKWNRMHHNQSTLNCTTTHQTHDHIENLQKNYNFFKWNWVGILCDRHFKPIHIHTQNSAHKTTRRNRHLPVCRTHGITLWIYGEFSLLILIHRQFSLSELSICVWWTLFTSSSESGEYCKIISKETWTKEETYTKKNNETTDKKWCAPEWLSDSLSGNLHAYHHRALIHAKHMEFKQFPFSTRQPAEHINSSDHCSCENAFLIWFSISFSLYLYLNVCMCTFARRL